jgi:hypothetical protein
MKHQLGKTTARGTAKALKEAEARLVRPEDTRGGPVYMHISPKEIKERLELFQPRRPGWGMRELDTKHINTLKTRIERKGELDPVLVVKLKTTNPYTGAENGHEWCVVDGHHRVKAYLKLTNIKAIKCEWFNGTAREAMDEGLRRNEKVHLAVDQGDKAEAAWTRTVMDWNGKDWNSSKRQVVEITGCGEGSVAHMRRWFKANHYYNKADTEPNMIGERLRNALGHDLGAHSWNRIKEVGLEWTPKEVGHERRCCCARAGAQQPNAHPAHN